LAILVYQANFTEFSGQVMSAINEVSELVNQDLLQYLTNNLNLYNMYHYHVFSISSAGPDFYFYIFSTPFIVGLPCTSS